MHLKTSNINLIAILKEISREPAILLLFFVIVLALVLSLTGCQTQDEYRAERVKKADEAFRKIKEQKIAEGIKLTLPQCIHLALKNNLDLKVYQLKAAVDKEQRTAAMLGMLPDLVIQDNLSYRNNSPGASSVSYYTGTQSLEPSYSSQQYENQVRVELLFSVIDFGLAYMNSVQSQDKRFVTDEEKRRAAQNLILDVTRSYFNVAAAQYGMEEVEQMLAQCDVTDRNLEDIKKNKSMPVTRAIEEQKRFLALKRDLKEYRRSYENSCIELRSLMGYYPASEIRVDDSIMDRGVNLTVPDIGLLENIALLERPELYQLDLQHHITVVEARKTIITMFPNVRAFVDFTGDSNIYLINRTWWEVGMRAAYNLLRLPQQIEQYRAIDKQTEQIDAQAMALSVGILAQVRIAYANMEEVKDRYLLMERTCEVYKQHVVEAEKLSKVSGGISKIELNRIEMESARANIDRTEALGNYYLAYYRMLNSIGVESLDKEKLEELRKRIKDASVEIKKDQGEKVTEYEKQIAQYKPESSGLGIKASDLQKQITQEETDIKALENALSAIPANKANELKASEAGYNSSQKALGTETASARAKLERLNASLSKAKEELQKGKDAVASAENTLDKNLELQKEEESVRDGGMKGIEKRYLAKEESLKEQIADKKKIFNDTIEELENLRGKTGDSKKEQKIAEAENAVKQNSSETNALEAELAKVQTERGEKLKLAEQGYGQKSSELEKSIAASRANLDSLKATFGKTEGNISGLNTEIETLQQSLDKNLETLQDAGASHKENLEDINKKYAKDSGRMNEELSSKKNALVKDRARLAELKTQLAEVNNKLDEAQKGASASKQAMAGIDDTGKYDIFINKLESIGTKQAKLAPSASDMNMEMSQQMPGNTVTPEAYNGTTNDINIQTMKDSDDNTLSQAEYAPTGKPTDVTNQMIYDTDRYQLNNEQMNDQRYQTDNEIVNQQMKTDTIQQGRSGN